MKFTSTLIAVFAICAQLANGSAIATRGEERRTPYNTICTSTCAGPVSDDCTAMANGLFAQGNTPLYMGAGTNLEYNQGTCRMVFYVDAQDTITYSKFGIARNILAIRNKCLGGDSPSVGIAAAKDGNWHQVLSHSV